MLEINLCMREPNGISSMNENGPEIHSITLRSPSSAMNLVPNCTSNVDIPLMPVKTGGEEITYL